MRRSDWSSDVCCSDLGPSGASSNRDCSRALPYARSGGPGRCRRAGRGSACRFGDGGRSLRQTRSDERRVGKACVLTFISRCYPFPYYTTLFSSFYPPSLFFFLLFLFFFFFLFF